MNKELPITNLEGIIIIKYIKNEIFPYLKILIKMNFIILVAFL